MGQEKTAAEQLVSYVLTCERQNTAEWFEGLAERINAWAAATGEVDRVEVARGGRLRIVRGSGPVRKPRRGRFSSKRSQAAAAAAIEFCKAARREYVDRGLVGRDSWPWFDRWLRLAGAERDEQPVPVRAVWCGSCRRWHVAGQCVVSSGGCG